MSKVWTSAQSSAMETMGRTLLVSAAAGSGKTATLTERIIRRVTDPVQPADLSRMLIVTFTRAAASELKERISKALSEAIAKDPCNRHLQKQLIGLGSAHISTIDAFCYMPVKEHFAESGMPAAFRIADEAELEPLSRRVMDELIQEYYKKYAAQEHKDDFFSVLYDNPFANLCDSLTPSKGDETLTGTLRKLYNNLLNFPEGIERLKIEAVRLEEQSECDFLASDHGALLKDWLKEFCVSTHPILRDAIELISDDSAAMKAYYGALEQELSFIIALEEELENGTYESIHKLFSGYKKASLSPCRKPARDYTDLKNRKSTASEHLEKFRDVYFSEAPEQIKSHMKRLSLLCGVLYDFLSEYDGRMAEEKKLRGICDFTDNRRKLLTMLRNEDGSPSPLCRSYLENFDEVYIDEYQDVDEVQDTIFRLIGGNHRFMVGDIKQSIYGFRGADPSVFARYRRELTPLTRADDVNGNSIFMSENFRCDESVIKVTNAVCGHMFSACPTSVAYQPEDDLGFAKKPPCEGYVSPQVHLAVLTKTGKNEEKGELSGVEAEAAYVANRIAALLRNGVTRADGQPITPGDIAILMRSRTALPVYTAALTAMGIPTGCEELEASRAAKDILHGPDMIYLVNLLRVINNPDSDIPLTELLRCDFPSISLDDLITLRQSSEGKGSMYAALEAYLTTKVADSALYEKVSAFVDWIEGYRALSATLSADGLLRLLRRDERVSCRKTRAFTYLYDSARTCRVAPFVGLYTFLNYFENKLRTEKRAPTEDGTARPGGTVTLMTIHHSKGLEFPVCFVVRCGQRFNDDDLSEDMIFEKSSGVAMKLYDREGHRKYDHTLRRSAALAMMIQQKEEEMRVLYVAMTRARERLYLVGFESKADTFGVGDRFGALSQGSYMAWIESGLASHPEIDEYCHIVRLSEAEVTRDEPLTPTAVYSSNDEHSETAAYYQHLLTLKKTPSPLEEMVRSVPTKVPASRMTDMLLDECVFYTSDLPVGDEDKLPASERNEPNCDARTIEGIRQSIRLMEKSGDDEFELLLKSNTRPTAAEKGTATHMFLQYCSWSRVMETGLEEEISRLCKDGFITERVTRILDRKQLEAFFASRFVQKAMTAVRIERELKFQRFIPLRDLTKNTALAEALEDRALSVQGSIDLVCLYSDGRIELCDYKTDHLTREEKADRTLLTAHLKEKHGAQLRQYAAAIEERYHRKPDSIYIFSLPLGEAVEITMEA